MNCVPITANDFLNDNHEIKLKKKPLSNAKNKARPKQYYKLLLNAMKVEINATEFVGLVNFSNQAELLIWVLSMGLYYSGNKEFPLVYFHILHFIRGLVGYFITFRLPKSFELTKYIETNTDLLKLYNFNDIIREAAKKTILPNLYSIKWFLVVYFTLTFVNFVVDIFDFFYAMSFFVSKGPDVELVSLTFAILNFLYIGKSKLK